MQLTLRLSISHGQGISYLLLLYINVDGFMFGVFCEQ